MSDIINSAESLSLNKKVSIAQTKSQSGKRLAQKRGPTLYNLEVKVPTQRLNGDKYYLIEEEMMKLGYGSETFNSANISGVLPTGMTSPRGVWSFSPVVSGASQTGTSINVYIGSATVVVGYAKALDYVQFTGSRKVYQITADASSNGSGVVTLQLNSPLVGSPGDLASVVFGDSVDFNFAIMKKPHTSYLPGELVQYGDFVFEEVIE